MPSFSFVIEVEQIDGGFQAQLVNDRELTEFGDTPSQALEYFLPKLEQWLEIKGLVGLIDNSKNRKITLEVICRTES